MTGHVCVGAGAGIAKRFAREGYEVALVSRRQETIDPIERELRAAGATTLSVPSDAGEACISPEGVSWVIDVYTWHQPSVNLRM